MKTEKKKESVFKQIGKYMGKSRALMPVSLIFSALSTALTIMPMIFIWLVLRDLLGDNPTKQTLAYQSTNLIVIGVTAILGILTYFVSLMCSHLAQFRAEVGIQNKAFSSVMHKPMGYFTSIKSGEIRNAIHEGAESTHMLFAHALPDLVASMLVPVIVIVSMIYVDWRMGLAALIPFVVGFITMGSMMFGKSKQFMAQYIQAQDLMAGETVEYIRGVPVLKVFNQSINSFKKLYNLIQEYHKTISKYTKMWEVPFALYLTIVSSASFIVVPIAYSLAMPKGTNIADIIIALVFVMLISPQLSIYMMQSAKISQSVNMAKISMDKMEKILEYKDIEFGNEVINSNKCNIEFKNVSFAYDKNKVLDNVSFTVKQGERIALVGPSGSGKSTIAKLAVRFYDTSEGEILVGDKNIKEYEEKNLRENISFIFQNTKLFSMSIRDNVLMGRTATDEEINKALKLARADSVVAKLPNGLDTVIGTKGTYLSGGECQRVSLARAMLRQSPIVILDEATAFADPENEKLMYEGLAELSKGKTAIYIAHRLNLVKDLDRILYIEDGKVVESGTHDELCKNNGGYKKMYDEYCSSLDWKLEVKNA